MMRIKKVAVFTVLSIVGALGLAACGDTPATSTPVAPTAAATKAPTAAVSEPTTAPTEAVSEPTTQPTTEATAVVSEPTTEPTAMVGEPTVAATAGTGGLRITGPAADLLQKQFATFKDVTSYHSTIEAEAAGVTSKIESDFQAPDRSRTIIDTPAGPTESIVIGNQTYVKSPGIDGYMAVNMNTPTTDMRDTSFLPFIQKADIIGDETINGIATTRLTYTYDASQATPGANMGLVTIEMWVDKATNYPVRQKVVTTSPTASTTTITFSKINEPISPPIEKPTNIVEIPGMEGGIPTVAVP